MLFQSFPILQKHGDECRMSEGFKERLGKVYNENYNMYFRLAVRLLRMYTGETDHAMDIVQEAFETAMEKPEQSRLNMEKWLSKTIKNLCRNYSRTYHGRKEKMASIIRTQAMAAKAQNIEAEVDLKASIEQSLSEKDYLLIRKYCVERCPIEELARETGMTPNAIRVRICRIKKVISQIIISLIVIITLRQYIL